MFLVGGKKFPCLNFGAKAACRYIIMLFHMDTPMLAVRYTKFRMDLDVNRSGRDKGYNINTLQEG